MTRHQERAFDGAEYVIGGSLFFIVGAVTATVMAVGLAIMTVLDRVLH